MIKFFRLCGPYFFGLSFAGIIAFLIQEIPYMMMPLINPASNPIMNMQNEIPWLEKLQGIVGMLSIVLVMLVVREDTPFFSIDTTKEKVFFALTVAMIAVNFVGWTMYYLGWQHGWLIVISQFAAVPLYYLFFGLWKGNIPLAVTAAVFFVIHTINGCLNFLVR